MDRTFFYKCGDMVKVRSRSRAYHDVMPFPGEVALDFHNSHKVAGLVSSSQCAVARACGQIDLPHTQDATRQVEWEEDCKHWETLVLTRVANSPADQRRIAKHIQAQTNYRNLFFTFPLCV